MLLWLFFFCSDSNLGGFFFFPLFRPSVQLKSCTSLLRYWPVLVLTFPFIASIKTKPRL